MEHIITKIEVQKNNKERVNVFVNEEYLFSCSAELVYLYGLKKGKIEDFNGLKEIINEDNYIKAKNIALKHIERTYKTEQQIVEKLLKAEYDENIIKRVIIFLKEYKFIDDEKYAELYVKDKIKGKGKLKIKQELINKGISEELIMKNLNDIKDQAEEDGAYKLALKKFNLIIKNIDDRRKIEVKITNYMVGRGYSYDIIKDIVKSIMEENISAFEEKVKEQENISVEDEEEKEKEIFNLALKRYDLLVKSEKDTFKIKKKLSDYLLRRGYRYDDIKNVLKEIIKAGDC